MQFKEFPQFKNEISPRLRSSFVLKAIGAVILVLNKCRHMLKGYTTPRLIDITKYDDIIHYDVEVTNMWMQWLELYAPDTSLQNKTVLELGPGADLGIGAMCIVQGAKKYITLDKHRLLTTVSLDFYTQLFNFLKKKYTISNSLYNIIMSDIDAAYNKKKGSRIVYNVDSSFSLRSLDIEKKSVDLILSNAAFEHFEDLAKLLSELSDIVKKDALFVAQIDLQTHSRWIRDADPNNIYRYSSWFYNLCKFSGSPNRMRPRDYAQYMEDAGWTDVTVVPLQVTSASYTSKYHTHMHKQFKYINNDLDILTCMVLARKL